MGEERIVLGMEVKDKITGASGIAVARTEYLWGCARVGVQIRELKDGKPQEYIWFDEPMLEGIEPDKKKPGGPRPDPIHLKDPS
jgi:hypothetical protein